MSSYRRKPRPVEAHQVTEETATQTARWCGGKIVSIGYNNQGKSIQLPTFEGTMTAMPGDWILRAEDGAFYVRTNKQFENNYEVADDV